jgi:uncharacterized protein YecE (DUF72 family)
VVLALCGRFKTVELNAPFYSWPTIATVESWKRQAGRRQFVYTVKACELITHIRRFAGTKTLVRDFGLIADLLGPRMGCFLFQLPPSFRYTPAPKADSGSARSQTTQCRGISAHELVE